MNFDFTLPIVTCGINFLLSRSNPISCNPESIVCCKSTIAGDSLNPTYNILGLYRLGKPPKLDNLSLILDLPRVELVSLSSILDNLLSFISPKNLRVIWSFSELSHLTPETLSFIESRYKAMCFFISWGSSAAIKILNL